MRKTTLKFYFKFVLVAALVFGICFGAGAGMANLFNRNQPSISAEENQPAEPEQPGERTSILVLGSDERKGETASRSDTIILVTIDPNLNKVAVVSIPRDTRVTLSGGEVGKINAAYAYGGPEASVKAVQNLMGIPVDYYVELNFEGFAKVVDTLGGVTIDVPQRMYKPIEGINLYPGLQRLNGSQALAFVRYRDYQLGDIDRASKQQQFLTALAAEILQPSTIPKLPALINEARPYLDTNMGLKTMLKLSSWAPKFTAESVVSQTLPGYFYDQMGADNQLLQSYWVADKSSVNGLVDKMLAGQTVAVVQEGSVVVQPKSSSSSSSGTNQSVNNDSGKSSGDSKSSSETSGDSKNSGEASGDSKTNANDTSKSTYTRENRKTSTTSTP
jgi:LCP family protein required for cell wall assembly